MKKLLALTLVLCTIMAFGFTARAAASVSYADVMAAAKVVADTAEAKDALPIKVKCGSTTLTHAQFVYYAAKVIVALNKGTKSGTLTVKTVAKAPNPQGSTKAYNMYKKEYAVRAQRLIDFVDKNNNTCPNFMYVDGGQLKYQNTVFAFAKILRYYKANGALPNYCYVKDWYWKSADVDLYPDTTKAVITAQPKSISVTIGATATFTVKANYAKSYQWQGSTNGGKTWYNCGGNSATLSFKATKDHNGRRYRCNVKGAKNSVSTTAVTLTVTAAPKDWHEDTSAYKSYLVATKNCQSTNATIKSVAATGVKYGGAPKTMYQAAKQLMKYLNNKTKYYSPMYSNTRYGAVGTWNRRAGNCCDLAHLANACARSQGIPGRYCHGYCKFQSGLRCGHVWAEFWCGKSYGWKTVDLVSDYNYLGYKNNTTLSFYNRYASLPF